MTLILVQLKTKWDFFLGRMEENGTLETRDLILQKQSFLHYLILPCDSQTVPLLVTSQEAHFNWQQVGTWRAPHPQESYLTSLSHWLNLNADELYIDSVLD